MANPPLGPVLRHIRKLAAAAHAKEQTDVQLLQEFAARNDQAAFAALVRRHGPMVLGVCRNVLRHTQDAEDAFQATFFVLARKAGTIRKAEALVSWLHGVAYRMAMNAKRNAARRRSHEQQAQPAPQSDPAWETAWQEVQVLLDEEIDRLPEKYRAAFLLCCLENKSAAEAGQALGIKEGTVRTRLCEARKRLQERLTRRGVTLSAVLAVTALSGNGLKASVPSLLLDTTVQAASMYAAGQAATVSASVAALVKGATKIMTLSKAKIASVLLLAAGLLAGGSTLLMQPTQAAKATASVQPEKPPAQVAPPEAEPDDTKEPLEISGKVLGPDGQPFAGAKVYLWTSADKKQQEVPPRASTGTDGRFRFAVTRADLEDDAKVIAVAKDFGPDWIELSKDKKPGDITLRLAKDDMPITGRILDLEGRPVAGVTVHVRGVAKKADGDLAGWIDQNVRTNGRYLHNDGLATLWPAPAGTPTAVTTDKQGRFELRGFGRDRVVTLDVRGQTIEHTRVWAVTRTGPEGGWIKGAYGLYGATLDHVAAPSRPFVGTVIDRRTRQPLAGIKIESDWAAAVTNEKGEYRLGGVAKKPHYWLTASGGKGIPYFDATRQADDTQGYEPIRMDFELTRGVEVTGRLTDKTTGKPVRGYVAYDPLPDNPDRGNAKSRIVVSSWGQAGPDGTFTTLALPGPGLLLAHASDASGYTPIDVREELEKLGIKGFPVAATHAIVKIDVSEKDPLTLRHDLALEPARTRQGSVVGPDGQPLAGVRVAGLTVGGPPQKLDGVTFTVKGLSPTRTRILLFVDAEKKLGKVVTFRGDQEGPLVVRLEPLGTLAGRIVDAEGKPLEAIGVTTYPYTKEEFDNLPHETVAFQGGFGITLGLWHAFTTHEMTTGADGMFRFEGLLPGLTYQVYASRGDLKKANTLLLSKGNVKVEAGKTNDLGDLKERTGNEQE